MKYICVELFDCIEVMIEVGDLVIGVGVGIGIFVKFVECGGVDFFIIYNLGCYWMNGCGFFVGFLLYGDVNEIVVEMGYEVILVVEDMLVFVGVNGIDFFCDMSVFIEDLCCCGFLGV